MGQLSAAMLATLSTGDGIVMTRLGTMRPIVQASAAPPAAAGQIAARQITSFNFKPAKELAILAGVA